MSSEHQCQSYANIPLFSYLHQTFTQAAILGRFIEGRAGFASGDMQVVVHCLVIRLHFTSPTLKIIVFMCALGIEVHLELGTG